MRWPHPRSVVPAVIFAVTAVSLLAEPGRCGWPEAGLVVSARPGSEWIRGLTADGVGGVYVLWSHSGFQTSLQHIDEDGNVAAGWPPEGIELSGPYSGDASYALDIYADGAGGVYVLLEESINCGPKCGYSFVSLHRRLASGTPPAGWGSALDVWDWYQAAPDGYGGSFLAKTENLGSSRFVLRARRIGPQGLDVAGWPAEGVLVSDHPGTEGYFSIAPDGQGGLYGVWLDDRNQGLVPWGNRDVYAQHFLATGQAAWPSGGLPVCADLRDQYDPRASADGTGNLLVRWRDFRNQSREVTYIQRVLPDGSPAPGWTLDGVGVTGGDATLVPDGSGGCMLVSVASGFDVRLERLTSSGAMPGNWPVGGILVSGSDVSIPAAVTDGRFGVYLTGQVFGSAWAHHLGADGGPAPGWPASGRTLASSADWVFPMIEPDGREGAFLAWHGDPDGDYDSDIYLTRLSPDGVVPVAGSVVSTEVDPSRVRIMWSVSGSMGTDARVERLADPGVWEDLGEASLNGEGRITFEDLAVPRRVSIGYRLSLVESGASFKVGEVWVNVPVRPALALGGFSPNPSSSSPRVSFALPSSDPAVLELFDIRGRLIETKAVGSLGPGRHELELNSQSPMSPGVYLVRLRQGTLTLVKRGCIVR